MEQKMLSTEELLLNRYPLIHLHRTFQSVQPYELFQEKDGEYNARRNDFFLYPPNLSQDRFDSVTSSLPLERLEIVYCYGLGLGDLYRSLSSWLAQKKERALIFLEDDLAVIEVFLQSNLAKDILSNPQVHIAFIPDSKAWDTVILELVNQYLSDRIACIALPSYQKKYGAKWARKKVFLMRSAAAVHALFSEVLHPHFLFNNVWKNVQKWTGPLFYANRLRGCFSNIPAVICGAGPSLEKALPTLRLLEDRALIFAGGSAITALSRQEISPHFAMAVDPNPEEVERLKKAKLSNTPFLYCNRVHPDIFPFFKVPLGYLRSDTGGAIETWLEKQLGLEEEPIGPELGEEAFSVTTLALAFAVAIGCNPIIFVGVDLAYTNNLRYADGVVAENRISWKQLQNDPRVLEKPLKRRAIDGRPTRTLLKWVMESEAIAAFAQKHPSLQFFNASEGIGFKNIPNLSIDKILQQHLNKIFPLRKKIQLEIKKASFSPVSPCQLKNWKDQLHAHLKEAERSATAICSELSNLQQKEKPSLEGGKLSYLYQEFSEQPARTTLFPALDAVLDRLLQRRLFPHDNEKVHCALEQTKWKYMQQVIKNFLDILEMSH
jgi:hypothetical protein